MAKYVIEIPDDRLNDYVSGRLSDYELLIPVQVGLKERTRSYGTGLIMSPYTEPDEQEIRDKAHEEAWEFAKQVSIMKPEDKHKLWGTDKYNTINFGYSYSEAKVAYDAWKADKEKIHVGDEVRHNSSEEIAIAIRVLPTCVYGIVTSKDELKLAQWNIYNLTKIGRSFPEVVELLEKMKEES